MLAGHEPDPGYDVEERPYRGIMGGGLTVLPRETYQRVAVAFMREDFSIVVEAASVMIQVGYFKLSHGKRVFKMAPLHHHFELMGWDEVTVVIRFWIICGTAVVTGMSVFYAQWVLGQ